MTFETHCLAGKLAFGDPFIDSGVAGAGELRAGVRAPARADERKGAAGGRVRGGHRR